MKVHWVRKFPFFCSDREYIIARRIWNLGGAYYCVTKVKQTWKTNTCCSLMILPYFGGWFQDVWDLCLIPHISFFSSEFGLYSFCHIHCNVDRIYAVALQLTQLGTGTDIRLYGFIAWLGNHSFACCLVVTDRKFSGCFPVLIFHDGYM